MTCRVQRDGDAVTAWRPAQRVAAEGGAPRRSGFGGGRGGGGRGSGGGGRGGGRGQG